MIPSDDGGRHKTVSQIFAIIVILLFLVFKEAGIKLLQFWSENTESVYKNVIFALMLVTTTLTLVSGLSYLIKNKEIISNAKTN